MLALSNILAASVLELRQLGKVCYKYTPYPATGENDETQACWRKAYALPP